MDDQKPPQWPAGRFGYPEMPTTGRQAASGTQSPENDAPDATDWAEMLGAGPGALWAVPEMEITQLEPEIPMPTELEAAGQSIDHVMSLLLGYPPGDIATQVLRAMWAEVSAALMAYRRRCAAITEAHTELDYYREDQP
ncbi:hypothetical protein A5717_26120 [Mycolicibacterium porcinum]|uniref:hypothetical protein n=1 Tax=Mycolicibacterium porcinum TaxID=39693 RepID=UPI00080B435E|nr:hypothetical protein [Mycolicibacterium porcinum]OCB09254.1 hypothetical protein A5717_26120 [Mycolicibacterium porcinum]